jgi:hypothetical protein
MTVAEDLTAVIPTFERQHLLGSAIEALLSGQCVPRHILVSEGSRSAHQRKTTEELVDSFADAGSPLRLLSEPTDGRMCGNRNHLVRAVETRFLLMIDDDCCVHPAFASDGLNVLRAGDAEIITATPGPLSFDFRGFWRPARVGESVGISLRCCMGKAEIFKEHPLDESISYGSEDADLTFRLAREVNAVRVAPMSLLPVDMAATTVRYKVHELYRLEENSRILVGIRRYWLSRPRLVLFLAVEVAAWVLRRQALPRECAPGQWRSVGKHLIKRQICRP